MAFNSLLLRRLSPAAAELGDALLLRSTRPAVAASSRHLPRAFSNTAQLRDPDDDGGEDGSLASAAPRRLRRRGADLFPALFSGAHHFSSSSSLPTYRSSSLAANSGHYPADVFEPFYPARSLAQVLGMMEQAAEGSLLGSQGGGLRRGWDAREDGEGLYLRVDMPGLAKEDVKVAVEEDTLVIRGESAKDEEGGGDVRTYGGRIGLPGRRVYEYGKIRAEMKNGVLKVFVPKVKEEERKDVLQVEIE